MIIDKWSKTYENIGIKRKLIDKIKPGIPLRNKIEVAQKKLQLQISKLEIIYEKLQLKNNYIFKKIVHAQKDNNIKYAKAYAIELLEVRKMVSIMGSAKLAMEQIQLRLNTVSELGDIIVTLSPCMSIIKDLGTTLNGIIPETNSSMQDLSKILGDILSSSSVPQQYDIVPQEQNNADTLAILEEAQSIIEKKTKTNIPEPPNSLTIDNALTKEGSTT